MPKIDLNPGSDNRENEIERRCCPVRGFYVFVSAYDQIEISLLSKSRLRQFVKY